MKRNEIISYLKQYQRYKEKYDALCYADGLKGIRYSMEEKGSVSSEFNPMLHNIEERDDLEIKMAEIRDFINQLDGKPHKVIWLRTVINMNFKQIHENMGYSRKQIYRYYDEGIEKLEKMSQNDTK